MIVTLTSAHQILETLGIADTPGGLAIGSRYEEGAGPRLTTVSPIDGAPLKDVGTASVDEVAEGIKAATRERPRRRL